LNRCKREKGERKDHPFSPLKYTGDVKGGHPPSSGGKKNCSASARAGGEGRRHLLPSISVPGSMTEKKGVLHINVLGRDFFVQEEAGGGKKKGLRPQVCNIAQSRPHELPSANKQ